MPVLLYCVAAQSASGLEQVGVAGLPVIALQRVGLAAFFSMAPEASVWLKAPVKSAALEFHHVCMEAFRSDAIIPYRFPTIFPAEEELGWHLEERAEEYKQILRRIAGLAQMEVRVTRRGNESLTGSGAEYLRERQRRGRETEAFGKELEGVAASVKGEWRQRTARDGLRGFGLILQTRIDEFKAAISNLQIPATLNVRVSGPWPVTEFLDLRDSDVRRDAK